MPTKDSVEEIWGKKLTNTMNVIVTLVIVVVSMALSLRLTNISTVMAFLGATTNSAVGFLLPIVYFWHVEKKKPWFDTMKLLSYFFFGFVLIGFQFLSFGLFKQSVKKDNSLELEKSVKVSVAMRRSFRAFNHEQFV